MAGKHSGLYMTHTCRSGHVTGGVLEGVNVVIDQVRV